MAKNQTSFKKGQSGNPKGAPKRDWSWSSVLEKAVQKAIKLKKTGKNVTVKEIVAESLVDQAIKGNVRASIALMNRMDGVPQQSIDLTSQGEKLQAPIIYKPKKNE